MTSDAKVLERMKTNDKLISELLEPLEKQLGIKFNKIDQPKDPKYEAPNKKKNLKLALKKSERKRKKLLAADPEKAKKIKWQDAMDKAKGIKVKDDPKLIKKSMKKKQALKKKHRKKWAERTEKKPKPKK